VHPANKTRPNVIRGAVFLLKTGAKVLLGSSHLALSLWITVQTVTPAWSWGRLGHRVINHWHFVVWPEQDGQLTDFFHRVAHTHAVRWRVSHRTVGYGHLYQGRFKSFPVQGDDHLLPVLRYVERNPLSAGLVEKAELWRWGSLWARGHGEAATKALLSPWPVKRPANWITRVNSPLSAKELNRVRLSVVRGQPYGDDEWVRRTVKELDLEHTVRPEGRPRKGSQSETGTAT
jgi:REP-associated tyrosine transposase